MRERNESREAFVKRLIASGRILATERDLANALLQHFEQHTELLHLEDGRILTALECLESLLDTKAVRSAEDRLNALAEEKSRKEGISYSEAFHNICSENPSLAYDYASLASMPVSAAYASESPMHRLNEIAESKVRTGGLSFSEAFHQAQVENPSLAREYVNCFVS